MDDTEKIEAEATDVAPEAASEPETKEEAQHDQSSGGVLAAAASFVDAVTNAGTDQPEGLDDGVLDLLGLERLDDDEDTAGGLAAVTVVPVVAETVAEPGEEAPVRRVTLRRRLDVIKSEGADVRAEARRQAKIDAAVRARLEEMEESVRKEVTEQVDSEGAEA